MERARGKADIIIGKNRHGRPETVRTAFLGDYSLFDNLPDEMEVRGGNPFDDAAPPPVPATSLSEDEVAPTPIDIDEIPDDLPL
jgi:hypothetical protein